MIGDQAQSSLFKKGSGVEQVEESWAAGVIQCSIPKPQNESCVFVYRPRLKIAETATELLCLINANPNPKC